MFNRALKPWLNLDKVFKLKKSTRDLEKHRSRINAVFEDFINEHEAEYRGEKLATSREPSPYLDQLYTIRDKLTRDQIMEDLMFFLIGAYDTSGDTISSALLLLAMNPIEQTKVYDEISSVLSSETDEVDENKLAQMKYLDMVVKEALRLIPQILIYAREAMEDVKLSKLVS
jgi:cytochrome P450